MQTGIISYLGAATPANWLEIYALLLTLLIMMITLAQGMNTTGETDKLLWIYTKLFLLLCVPVLLLYGFFQPLPSDLAMVLKIQAMVLTLIVLIVLISEVLASIGLNRYVAYTVLILLGVVAVIMLLPLL